MTELVLIRHGETAWNAAGRIQGRTDTPLSEVGWVQVRSWRMPDRLKDASWLSSPLRRARDTASTLAGRIVPIEPRLIEADWGGWEGRTRAELMAVDPTRFRAEEAKGLDLRPPGGESPREVAARLAAVCRDLAGGSHPIVAVTHKGVLRAALILSTGWDMLAKPPLRMGRGMALTLRLGADGVPAKPVLLPLTPVPTGIEPW